MSGVAIEIGGYFQQLVVPLCAADTVLCVAHRCCVACTQGTY